VMSTPPSSLDEYVAGLVYILESSSTSSHFGIGTSEFRVCVSD
jgi:hypothetical protein